MRSPFDNALACAAPAGSARRATGGRTLTGVAAAYAAHERRGRRLVLCLAAAALAMMLLSLSWGTDGPEPARLWAYLTGSASDIDRVVFERVRAPRILAAGIVGATLAVSAVVMQNLLRNPLASASTLGVSQGAAFGAALAIVLTSAGVSQASGAAASVMSQWWQIRAVTLSAFAVGIATTLLIVAAARLTRITPVTMILCGVALGAMFAGATAIVQYFADEINVANIVYWTFGDLGRMSYPTIGVLTAAGAAALAYFQFNARNYDAMDAGLPTAVSLGIDVHRLVLSGMLAAGLIAALSVAFVGTIGFVGLISAHLARRITGNHHRHLIPASFFTGALLLSATELAARALASPTVLPIGAVTAFLGAPVFLYFAFKEGRGAWLK